MVNTVVFDIGMVLVYFRWRELFLQLGFEGEKFEKIAEATVRNPWWNEFDKGHISIEEIEEKFGPRVRKLVESETENKRADLPPESTWKIRKEESLNDLASCGDTDVLILWLGDKLANMRSFYRIWKAEGDSMWQSFNQKDPAQQKWYYGTIAELTSSLKEFAAWQEYNELFKIIFGNVN